MSCGAIGEPRPVHASQPVPSYEAAVVSLDDVAEGGFALSGINGGLDKTGGFAVLLIGHSNDASPQRSNGTRAADHQLFPSTRTT